MRKNNKSLLSLLLTVGMIAGCAVESSSQAKESSSVGGTSTPISESSLSSESSSAVSSSSSEESSSSKKDPVKLGAVTNLKVVREGETLTVTFDAVENASGYKLKVTLADAVVVEEQDITSGGTITPFESAGDYVISVFAAGDSENYLNGDAATFDYKVEIWTDHVDDYNCTWNARLEQGVIVGEANWKDSNNNTYVGTFDKDFNRVEGRFTYANGMYYEGGFKDNNFYDEVDGFFSWSTNGDHKSANSYRGPIINGTADGQIGTITGSKYYTGEAGFHYWTGEIQGMAEPKVGANGKGKWSYGGQYYEGDIYISANWTFKRIGQGENVWTSAENCGWFAGYTNTTQDVLATKEFDRYVGGFDDMNHGWFYGNGVMYIKNSDGTPYGYVAGSWDWSAGTLTEWTDFDTTTDLREEYRAEGVLNLTKAF